MQGKKEQDKYKFNILNQTCRSQIMKLDSTKVVLQKFVPEGHQQSLNFFSRFILYSPNLFLQFTILSMELYSLNFENIEFY